MIATDVMMIFERALMSNEPNIVIKQQFYCLSRAWGRRVNGAVDLSSRMFLQGLGLLLNRQKRHRRGFSPIPI